jgi:hypothetical protein
VSATEALRNVGYRRALLAAGLLLAATALVYRGLRDPGAGSPVAARPRSGAASTVEDLPRIDLARLAATPPEIKVGRRDVFELGRAEPGEDEGGANGRPAPTPIPEPTLAPLPTPVPGPRLANINLKYIGSLEGQGTPRVAVLLTDRNEVLYGEVGQQIANRYKILRIGFESVEVLDEGSGQSRRIPLKGN